MLIMHLFRVVTVSVIGRLQVTQPVPFQGIKALNIVEKEQKLVKLSLKLANTCTYMAMGIACEHSNKLV